MRQRKIQIAHMTLSVQLLMLEFRSSVKPLERLIFSSMIIMFLTWSDDDKTKATKRFWTYVKSKKKDSCTIAPLRSEGVLIADAVRKANVLKKQYCSVFTKG